MKILKYFIYTLFIITLISCGAQRQKQGRMDTPETHYKEGMKYIEAGRYKDAYRQFQLAVELNDDYAPAYQGMAYAFLGQNELESAEDMAKTAVKKGDDYWQGHIVLGKVYLAKKEYKDALDEFEDAYKINETSPKPARNVGYAYFKLGEYQKARNWYNKALNNKSNDKKTMQYLDELNEIQKAVAGMGRTAKKIALDKKITRADVAALFIDELDIEKYFRKKEKMGFKAYGEEDKKNENIKISDVSEKHWAYSFIKKVTKLGIMDLFPGKEFKPKKSITKADYAVFISRVLIKLSEEEGLATKYIGSASPFKDVPNSHFAFNGIMIATTRDIMETEISGKFGIHKEVPGRKAVMAIKKLKILLENKI